MSKLTDERCLHLVELLGTLAVEMTEGFEPEDRDSVFDSLAATLLVEIGGDKRTPPEKVVERFTRILVKTWECLHEFRGDMMGVTIQADPAIQVDLPDFPDLEGES